jgi:hypothetical protein
MGGGEKGGSDNDSLDSHEDDDEFLEHVIGTSYPTTLWRNSDSRKSSRFSFILDLH